MRLAKARAWWRESVVDFYEATAHDAKLGYPEQSRWTREFPRLSSALWVAKEVFRYEVGGRICKRFGHKVVCHGGWAGPDSGGEYLECSRCGWSKTITYY